MSTKKEDKIRIEVADFETTVYENQAFTEVWAAATVQLGTEDVHVFHSIDELFDYYCSLDCALNVYFHNLKFDGQFILYYLSEVLHYKQAVDPFHNDLKNNDFKFEKRKWMKEKTFEYIISNKGQWYSITVKINRHFITFMDSLKLLPFSVRELGKSFKTKHKKLDMDYEGFRYAGCPISDEEMAYIKNDVLVVKEALEVMFSQGLDKSTIGACCLSEFKKTVFDYDQSFPNLYEIEIDDSFRPAIQTEEDLKRPFTAGDYILRSYRGGWCYINKEKSGKLLIRGTTLDVNSLYPSMMSSESGNRFPVGEPHFWKGNTIPEEATAHERFYFVRFSTRFYLKPGKLPFVQIKRCTLYSGTESLATSDYIDEKTGKHYKKVWLGDKEIDTRQTLTMTCIDYILFREHYDVEDFEILDGCWFYTEIGIFDKYINRYKKMKLENTGALRTLAKLLLNNLYGKLSATKDSSFKVAEAWEDGALHYRPVTASEKTPGYIACGSAITSYARNFTIRAAQANYHPGERGFAYSDTDSIHCDLQPEEIKGVRIHDKDFCCWKIESGWDKALFVRQKTYIEHVVSENLKPVTPYNDIKCAGMTKHCKMLFEVAMEGGENNYGYIENREDVWSAEADGIIREGLVRTWTEEEKDFLFDGERLKKKDYTNFEIGLRIPGKLLPRTIKGGVILYNDYYTMR